jgi:3'-phosphoadenosine 5'-phosphosulfate sulfotransferase (PAPS reductase)/FAD synthetase
MRDAVKSAEQTIETALQQSARPCVTCSFQAEDVALVDLLRQRRAAIAVLFLDTGYHFAEVLRYRDELAAKWPGTTRGSPACGAISRRRARRCGAKSGTRFRTG